MNTLASFTPAKVWKATVAVLLLGLLLPPLISLAGPGFPFAGDAPGRPDRPPRDALMEGHLPPAPPPRGIHPAMLMFDADVDGVLSATEIAAAAQVILAMDIDRDGQVDEDELCAGLQLPPPIHDEELAGMFAVRPPPPAPPVE